MTLLEDKSSLNALWAKLNPKNQEQPITQEEALDFIANWQSPDVSEKQRLFVNEELKQLKHDSTPLVYNGFLQLLNLIPGEGYTFLDIGCASGYYYEVASYKYPKKIEYQGCDYNEKSIELAKKYYPDVPFHVEDVTKLTFEDKQFDIVMISGVLEHVPEQEKAFDEVCRVPKKWLICHRIVCREKEQWTKGSQYNVPVVRYYYNREKFIERIQSRGFKFHSFIQIYNHTPDIQSFLFERI